MSSASGPGDLHPAPAVDAQVARAAGRRRFRITLVRVLIVQAVALAALWWLQIAY